MDQNNGIVPRIEARIAALKAARDNFVTQANIQMAVYDAAISELETLLKPSTPVEAPPVTDTGQDSP